MGAFRDHVELRYPAIAERANTILDWSDTDTPDNPKRNKNYPPFQYSFNSFGFRCDEFDLSSELPIIFLGCSITEGVGIPAEARWSQQLLNKIRLVTGKKIPYWNLSLGGRGLLSQLDLLHAFTLEFGQPAHVFIHTPPFSRLEYVFQTGAIKTWTMHGAGDQIDLLGDEFFQLLQFERGLNYADMFAKSSDVTMVMWGEGANELQALNRCQNINVLHFQFGWCLPTSKNSIHTSSDNYARDGIHPGAAFNSSLGRFFWDSVKDRFQCV